MTFAGIRTRALDPAIERALADAVDTGSLDPAAANRLIEADIDTLPLLLEAACAVRDRRSGRTVTYSRKVFLPLTNLCRDQCAYCTFVRRPSDPQAWTMTPEEVLAVAEAGQRAGCREALFSLGDKPELRYASYRQWLARHGYARTIEYLRDMCELVLERTGLLPHANPGVMTEEDIALLRPVTASMGLMLESTSERLLERGGAHRGCPDKVPAVRLATIEAAGRLRVPFTTGILIGIGETPAERVDALYAIRSLQDRYGHIQEVIVQNFRRKPDIRMRDWPEPTLLDMLRTIAVARLILGTTTAVQAPPNLMPDGYDAYLLAGLDDWGGVSPVTRDYINPERAWPHLGELKRRTERMGFTLRERLAVYPSFLLRGDEFLDPRIRERVRGFVDPGGLVPIDEELW
ncbi:MAG: 7,8-didemethyl-8-hydroxy-5-deazariboflavin synthase CofG [Thermomicrobium sp.]|nr:7,8-didemethyl-8-hydroxy-5-deazariboflavin synthase CofG [Thermomicrobium sp.]